MTGEAGVCRVGGKTNCDWRGNGGGKDLDRLRVKCKAK